MDFEKLMAKAMAVTQQQDAALAEKARRKLKEEDERRMRELKAERERQRLQEQLERKKNEEKQQQSKDKKKRKGQMDVSNNKKSNSNKLTTPKRSNSKSNAIAALQQLQPSAQKKDMSFEELMAQANKLQQKKQSDPTSKIPSSSSSSMSKKNERSTISGKRPPTSASSSHTPRNNNNNNNDHNKNNNTPSIYRNRPSTMSKAIRDSTRPIPTSTLNMSARDKVRQMMRQPPQKLNTQKRDLRSISEIQRDIRHKKGIYSDEEEDIRSDPRLLQNKRGSLENRYNNKIASGPLPSSRSSFPAGKRPAGSAAAAMMNRNRNMGDSRRMPFSRPVPERRRPMQRYEEDEDEEEMDDFVVNDEEEEEEVNDYSAEIGRIFRYNKKRYRNETFSDDDMEADAREVLREEKRSERIGRREDIEEEKRELERLKRLKTKGKSRP